jgi:hypothetical protein
VRRSIRARELDVFEAHRKFRKRLGAKIEVGKIFLVLKAVPIINNVIHLIRTL